MQQAMRGPGGTSVESIAPGANDRFVVKPRYSAFDHTPLELILRDLEIDCASTNERLEQVALTYLEEVVGAQVERATRNRTRT